MATDQVISMDVSDEFVVKDKPVYSVLSRLFDVLASFVSLVVALPILLIVGIAIKLEDGDPVFYSQTRLGKDGREFTIFKLRSMRVDAEINGAQWAGTDDERITKVGRFIRKTRIDEIPQLYNILVGDMNLIGEASADNATTLFFIHATYAQLDPEQHK